MTLNEWHSAAQDVMGAANIIGLFGQQIGPESWVYCHAKWPKYFSVSHNGNVDQAQWGLA